MFSSASLRLKLTAVIGLMGLAAALALSQAARLLNERQLVTDQQRLLTAAAQGLAAQMAQELDARAGTLQMLAETDLLRDPQADAPARRRQLEAVQRIHPELAWIGLTDAQGQVQAATGGLLLGASVAHRDWFSHGRQGLHFGEAHEAGLPPAPPAGRAPLRQLDIATPVRGPDGRTIGVLAAQLRLDWAAQLHRQLGNRLAADHVSLAVSSRQGQWLVGGPLGRAMPQAGAGATPAAAAAQLAAARPGQPQALRYTDTQGRRVLGVGVHGSGHGRFPGLGWQLVASADEAVVFAPARRLAAAVLALGLLAAGLTAALAWAALGRLLEPLRQAGQAAAQLHQEQLHQGALDTITIPAPPGRGEVARHTGALVALVHGLQKRNRELRLTRRVFDESSLAMALCEADGHVLTVNPAFETLTGHRPDRAPGRPVLDLLGQGLTAVVREQLAAQLRARHDWAGELPLCRSDGRSYAGWLSLHALRDATGRITQRIVVIDDITERQHAAHAQAQHRHQLEAQLAERTAALGQAQAALDSAHLAAERASQASRDVLAGLGHEMRAPLHAIIDLSHPPARDGDSGSTTPRPQLERIHTAATHLLAIVGDTQDVATTEAGRMAPDSAEFALAEVVAEAHDMLAEAAARKGLALVVDLQPLPARSLGDPRRLRQVLLNFLGHAIQFTELGQVRLEGHTVRQDARQCVVRLSVLDTGPGLDPQVLQRLFELDAQTDADAAQAPAGPGLGLALSRRLARLMGGEVGVYSTVGRGSRFWIELPLGAVAQPAQPAPPALPPRATRDAEPSAAGEAEQRLRQRRGVRVLLAEDNLVNQEVATALLQAAGVTVDVVDDGAAAVRCVQRQHYDLVLMDMQMPVLDGLAATRQIRRLPAGAGVPILAMTADAFGESTRACLDAGMNGHVSKPVEPETLYANVLRWLPVPPADALPAVASAAATPSPDAAAAAVPAQAGSAIATA